MKTKKTLLLIVLILSCLRILLTYLSLDITDESAIKGVNAFNGIVLGLNYAAFGLMLYDYTKNKWHLALYCLYAITSTTAALISPDNFNMVLFSVLAIIGTLIIIIFPFQARIIKNETIRKIYLLLTISLLILKLSVFALPYAAAIFGYVVLDFRWLPHLIIDSINVYVLMRLINLYGKISFIKFGTISKKSLLS